MSLRGRRLRRLSRARSPRRVFQAGRRDLVLRAARRQLHRALASDCPLVVGPFLGEVGYELLYWRPYVLRLLRSHDVAPGRVTVIGRGGSGRWYGEFAGGSVDAFELMPPQDVAAHVEQATARHGHRKQTHVEEFEVELVSRAAPDERAAVVHPLQMFWRMRFLWEGLEEPARAAVHGDYDSLPPEQPPDDMLSRLPERYVAVKLYYNECVPPGAATEEAYEGVVRSVGSMLPAVALHAGFAVDEHEDWPAAEMITLVPSLRPETNMAVQAAIVARADALVSTYGGFSYLGPFLGVPTLALGTASRENPNHERVLRAMLPQAHFDRVALGVEAVARVEALLAP